ncbi:MAG: hypothetical protein QXK06_00045 [Candidatus Diapherotrites archaeon]
MNERAFNLFTALLALILIILTAILVSSMVQSESNAKTIIAKTLDQSRIESMSRLLRADAFQSFNFATRDQMEDWFSKPDNVITVSDFNKWSDWNAIVDEFANDKFRQSEVFAGYIASNLTSLTYKTGDKYAGYEIKVEFDQAKFKEILKSVLEKSYKDKDFFQIIDCDGTPQGCPNGSFYLNLKFSKLDQSLYEQMPLVHVKHISGSTERRDPIIPKNDLKVYIPLRVFKALAITRGFMHSRLDWQMNSQNDFGYYSPRMQNEIDSMALGFCDYGYCHPRTNPYYPPDKKSISGKNCPDFIASGSYYKTIGETRGETFEYEAGNEKNTEDILKDLLIKRLCALSRELLGQYDNPSSPSFAKDFAVSKSIVFGQPCYVKVDRASIETTSIESKEILLSADDSKLDKSLPSLVFNPTDEPNQFGVPSSPCPYDAVGLLSESQRTGMFWDGKEIRNWNYGKATCTEDSGISGKTTCTQITMVSLIITYEEKDANYKVIDNRDVKIKIRTFDANYTPFNPKRDMGDPSQASGCLFSGPSLAEQQCHREGWQCYVPASSIAGCYPLRNLP